MFSAREEKLNTAYTDTCYMNSEFRFFLRLDVVIGRGLEEQMLSHDVTEANLDTTKRRKLSTLTALLFSPVKWGQSILTT